MKPIQYRLYTTDGYCIHLEGIFKSLQQAQSAMQRAYNLLTPKNWLEDFKDLSSINETDAILYANGESVFVWHIEEINFAQ